MATNTHIIPPQPGVSTEIVIVTDHTASTKDVVLDGATLQSQDATVRTQSYATVIG